MDSHMKNVFIVFLLGFVLLSMPCDLFGQTPQPGVVTRQTGPNGDEYFIKLPIDYSPQKTYWLAVGLHGLGSNGSQGLQGVGKDFAYTNECILIGPTFPNWMYYASQVSDLVSALREEYRLHDRYLLWGFSAGSTAALDYMMDPEMTAEILACSAHAGLEWWYNDAFLSSAWHLPFALSCGTEDYDIFSYRQFTVPFADAGFCFKGVEEVGVGHWPGPQAHAIKTEVFALAKTGLFPNQRAALDGAVSDIRGLIAAQEWPAAESAIAGLLSFEPPSLTYVTETTQVLLWDYPEDEWATYTVRVNPYGFTSNASAEAYLQGR